jgi:putative ABC transport system permease protein
MLLLTLKQLAAKKARLFTTMAAVLLGVTFLVGTLVLTDSIDHTLDRILADANAGTDAYIRTSSNLELTFGQARARLDVSLVEQVRSFDGVGDAVGRINGYAQILDADGEPVGNASQAPAFGLNWIANPKLNAYKIDSGHAPGNDHEIVIDKRSARIAHLQAGDRTTVLTSGAPQLFTISGVATFAGADSPGNATAVLFTDHAAAELLGEPGRVDGIAVTASDGRSQEELTADLGTALRNVGGTEVITGAELTREDQNAVADAMSFFNVFMFIFAGIAVFVGAFIINNTFAITVAQRTREMAMLRAIGADRRQVLRSVLIEALAIGVLASAIGLILERLAAVGLTAMLDSFGFDMPDGSIVLTARTVVVSATVGIGVTVASAWLPARRASRVAPIEALRSVAYEHSHHNRTRATVGLLATVAGVVALAIGLANTTPALVGLGAAIVFVAVTILGPVLVRPVVTTLGTPVARTRGIPGALAQHNTLRNPARTSRTAAALMIGVGLVAFITIFAASLSTSMRGSFADDFTGTHVCDSGAFDAGFGISPELAATIRRQPGVTAVSETRIANVQVNHAPTLLFAFEPHDISKVFDLGRVSGNLNALNDDGIAVSADSAIRHGWKLGDNCLVDQFVAISTFDRHVSERLDARIYVRTTNPAALQDATTGYATVNVLDEDGFIESQNEQVNTLLGLMYALLTLAVLIALLGIANTLTLSILERTRELGLLRALGMSRAQLRSTIRYEAVLIAGFGTLLGLATGLFFGWALVRALADEGITDLALPVAKLGVVAGIAVIAGLTAALLPARRAARLDILSAIAT